MTLAMIHRSLILSPTIQLLSRVEPISSSILPLAMRASEPLTWLNVGKICFVAGLSINNALYHNSKVVTRKAQIIHDCNRIFMLALFTHSIVKAWQASSWKPVRPLVLYAPLFASMAMSHPIFQIISEVSPKKSSLNPSGNFQQVLSSKLPFLVYLKNHPVETFIDFIHALVSKNTKKAPSYNIFTLSVWKLLGFYKPEERLLEIFDYLNAYDNAIVIIEEFEQIALVQEQKFLYDLLMAKNVTKGVQVFGTTRNTSLLERFPKGQTLFLDNAPPPELPQKWVKVCTDEVPVLFDAQQEAAQQVVEVLGNPTEMNKVCLVGDEENEKELLVSSVARLVKGAKPPLANQTLYVVNFQDLLEKGGLITDDTLKLLKRENIIVYVKGLEPGFQLLVGGGFLSNASLKTIVEEVGIKVIISATQEQYEALRKDTHSFQRYFYPHKMPLLSPEVQELAFKKQQETYTDLALSAHLRTNILEITGPCSLREQLALLGQVVSIMTQRGCTQEDALGVIQGQVAHQSKAFLPPNLLELTSGSDEIICLNREKEMLEILITLHSKDGKNNICLLGEPGCGKTQLVRYIASSIKKGTLKHFENYRVFSFSISSIMSDSTYIGMWQGKLRRILDFCQKQGKVIIFIDEIHLAIGNGKHTGNDTMDIAQMMKEYITDPDLRIIGATTSEEHQRYIRTDPAFEDRFKILPLAPLQQESQLKALEAHSTKYSPTSSPLPTDVLKRILSESGSLRTSVGRVAEIHSYMSYTENDDIKEAEEWAKRGGKDSHV